MHYIEGGWPGSNPKDVEFFERAKKELPEEAWSKIVAFGRLVPNVVLRTDSIRYRKVVGPKYGIIKSDALKVWCKPV